MIFTKYSLKDWKETRTWIAYILGWMDGYCGAPYSIGDRGVWCPENDYEQGYKDGMAKLIPDYLPVRLNKKDLTAIGYCYREEEPNQQQRLNRREWGVNADPHQ